MKQVHTKWARIGLKICQSPDHITIQTYNFSKTLLYRVSSDTGDRFFFFQSLSFKGLQLEIFSKSPDDFMIQARNVSKLLPYRDLSSKFFEIPKLGQSHG